jgi:MFS family permease
VLSKVHFIRSLVLDWSNTQNGKLLGSIGIASALLQGGYVRRSISKVGEVKMASRGVYSCAIGLCLLAAFPYFVNQNAALSLRLLQGGALCLAFTSATVVNSLTAYASLQCDETSVEEDTAKVVEELMRGQALGNFRSSGQLGRAIGPLLGMKAPKQYRIHG